MSKNKRPEAADAERQWYAELESETGKLAEWMCQQVTTIDHGQALMIIGLFTSLATKDKLADLIWLAKGWSSVETSVDDDVYSMHTKEEREAMEHNFSEVMREEHRHD